MKNIILIFMLCAAASAQPWIKVDTVFSPSGITAQNFSAPFLVDIDRDGDLDMFLGSSGSRTEFYENVGSGGRILFRRDTLLLAPIYANGYQYTNAAYPALCDIDGDGDYDLIIGGYNGLILYYNTGDSLTPSWRRDDSVFAAVNTEIGTDPRPAFVDIDGDGDLDLYVGAGESLFGGPVPGIIIAFRNVGTPHSPNFQKDVLLSQGMPDAGLNAYPSFADLDGDGDYDVVIGRDLNTLLYYQNAGSKTSPAWAGNTSVFSGIETTRYWKDPMLCDFDGNGTIDLLYGTDSGQLFFYKNTGSVQAPAFQYQSSAFKLIKLEGNGATSSLADFDGDGDYDLVSGDWLGKFQYFRNDGTKNKPVFAAATASFSSIDAGSYSSPIFVDYDNDGDVDIVTGALNGKIYAYKNTNSVFTADNTTFAQVYNTGISVPAFADIDGDGDRDLLIGADAVSDVKFFENKGGNNYIRNDTMLQGVSYSSYCRPVFYDVDNDGDFDLLLGRSDGSLRYFENKGTPKIPFFVLNDTLFAGVAVKQNAHAGFADLNNDGRPDMIVAEYDGNFSYYLNNFATPLSAGSSKPFPRNFTLYQNYPNPFNPATRIRYEIEKPEYVVITLYDLLGREAALLENAYKRPGSYEVVLNAASLSSGVYLYEMRAGDAVQVKKLCVLK